MNDTSNTDSLVISYLDLRKSIGAIGMSLPFVVAIGKILFESPGILESISAYYYSVMGNVFVGSLCAIAVFLFSYHGYDARDLIAGKLASLFALGTALFPTPPAGNASPPQMLIGGFHFFFAVCLFLTLAYFSLALFRKTNPNVLMTPKKKQRNVVYTLCGFLILVCIAGIIAVEFTPHNSAIRQFMPIFWLESIAIVSFGISWFVKGEAILKDD